MSQLAVPTWLDLEQDAQTALISAARDVRPISGLTHNFYRYPARFSPAFVRAAIECFTRPGDMVVDPYVGGGTTLVEALALGRHCLGIDISELAEFVATVKTTVLKEHELNALCAWAYSLWDVIHLRKPSVHFPDYEKRGYYKHLDHPSRWRLRRAIEQALASAIALRSRRLEAFARCAILRSAQWALDGRRNLPSMGEFRAMMVDTALQMIEGARELRAAVTRNTTEATVRIINRTAAGLEDDPALRTIGSPKLIVTSPPYPGIHVLYHRWQVDGRKETAAPFWIANKLDGAGSSFYTMGDRKAPELHTYFENLRVNMTSIAALCDDSTTLIQMVAFSHPSWQLPRYLDAMQQTGFSEMHLPLLDGEQDGRLWRRVPNRRWYSDQRGATPGSQEVVLFHRKAAAARASALQSRPDAMTLSEASSAKSDTTVR